MRSCAYDRKSGLNWLVVILFVDTFYLPSYLGQERAKGPFGLRVKLPLAHLFTTHGGGFTLSFLSLNVKQGSCEYQLLGHENKHCWALSGFYEVTLRGSHCNLRIACELSLAQEPSRFHKYFLQAKVKNRFFPKNSMPALCKPLGFTQIEQKVVGKWNTLGLDGLRFADDTYQHKTEFLVL